MMRQSVRWFRIASILPLLASCQLHRPTVMDSTRKGALFNHALVSGWSCSQCHETSRPMPPHNQTSDCVGCHTAGNGMTWKNITAGYHSPTPTSCNTCHASLRPALPHSQTGDCVTCHSPGTTLADWQVVSSNPHSPLPVSCTSCHEVNRAQAPSQPHFSTFDCASCHVPNSAQGATHPWLPATYGHSPVPTSCSACHENTRPAVANYPGLGPTVTGHYTNRDCYACHQHHTGTSTTVIPWSRSPWPHKTAAGAAIGYCLPCHEADGHHKHSSNNVGSYTDVFTYASGGNVLGRCNNCHTYPGW